MARRNRRRIAAPQHVTPSPAIDTRALLAAQRSGRWVWLGLALVIALGAGLAWRHFAAIRQRPQSPTEAPVSSSGPLGGVASCRQLPLWVGARGGSPRATLSTSEPRRMGLLLTDPGRPPYQHPSWDDAGWLGPILLDASGNVLVGPVPVINLIDNPPAGQNTLWRVDAVSEVMKPLLELPAAAPPSTENPFGIMGLALDCESSSVYASSVMGSDRAQERGRLFQLDPRLGAVQSQREGVDAIGLVIFRGVSGKRLYYGSARSARVYSLLLDAQGRMEAGPGRFEFSLEGAGPRGDDRARRMRIEPDGSLLVNGVEFSFNLVAPTEKPETPYRLRYDHGTDRWRLREIGQYEVTGNEGWLVSDRPAD